MISSFNISNSLIIRQFVDAGDVTAPTLTNPVDNANGTTAATGSVDTDEGNGTLYWVVSTSATPPSAAQVKAGQMHTGAAAADSGSQAVSGTGTQTLSPAPSGLTASTSYTIHFMHEDAAANQSAVSSGNGFTTQAVITFIGDTKTTGASSIGTHANTLAGDLFIGFFADAASTTDVDPTSGTEIEFTQGVPSLGAAYKSAANASDTITSAGANPRLSSWTCRGATEVVEFVETSGNGTSAAIPSRTITDPRSWIVCFLVLDASAGVTNMTTSDLTKRHGDATTTPNGLYDSNGAVSSWAGGTITWSNTRNYRLFTMVVR